MLTIYSSCDSQISHLLTWLTCYSGLCEPAYFVTTAICRRWVGFLRCLASIICWCSRSTCVIEAAKVLVRTHAEAICHCCRSVWCSLCGTLVRCRHLVTHGLLLLRFPASSFQASYSVLRGATRLVWERWCCVQLATFVHLRCILCLSCWSIIVCHVPRSCLVLAWNLLLRLFTFFRRRYLVLFEHLNEVVDLIDVYNVLILAVEHLENGLVLDLVNGERIWCHY